MKEIKFTNTEPMKWIRPIKPNDAARLADCLNTWGDDDSWGGSFGASKFTEKRVYDEWIKDASNFQMVLLENDEIQAYCSYDGHREDKDAVYIPLLGARPKQQGRGFGKALLMEALKRAINEGVRRLDLYTWAGNTRAVPLYKKTGFMWSFNTNVKMENYLPAILNTPFFNEFFIINDFYESRRFEMSTVHDDFNHEGMQAYTYEFEQDKENNLKIYVDHWTKELSGFEYIRDGEKLSVQLVPDKHEVFLGIDKPRMKLIVKNSTSEEIHITCELIPYKFLSLNNLNDLVVPAGSEGNLDISAEIDYECNTIIPGEHFYSRPETRFIAKLSINGVECQLGSGWVPKDAVKISLLNRSVIFGKYTESREIDFVYRNLTEDHLEGSVKINGEGIDEMILPINIGAASSSDFAVQVQRPETDVVKAWKWDIQFTVGETDLPVINKHIGCFTGAGAIAYVNPQAEAVIENDQYRYVFALKGDSGLIRVQSNTSDFDTSFSRFGIRIGMPFPDNQSEFWTIDKPFKVVKRGTGIALKQSFESKIEKPGLKITRWIELEPSKPFISSYYELENTGDNIIEQVAIRNGGYMRYMGPLTGNTIVPSSDGMLYLNDRGFADSLEYPNMVSDYAEPWYAREPYDGVGEGFGFIWDPTETKKSRFTPYGSPGISTKAYDVDPGQTIKIGHLAIVFGEPIARKTRNIWINEFNGKAVISSHIARPLIELVLGEELGINDDNHDFNWVDTAGDEIPLNITYLGRGDNPVDLVINIGEETFSRKLQRQENQRIMLENRWKHGDIYHVELEYTISHLIKKVRSTLVPYNRADSIRFEKIDDHWEFSNGYFTLKTSPNHGASVYSLKIDKELLFSRYPDKGSYSWFTAFTGGIYPSISAGGGRDFENEIWNDPVLVTDNQWTGFMYRLDNPKTAHNLKKLEITLTHMTREGAPLLWSVLKVKNVSGASMNVSVFLNLFLKSVNQISYQWNDQVITGTYIDKERLFSSQHPHNWVYVEGEHNFLFSAHSPYSLMRGYYMNAFDYSEFDINQSKTLKPGEVLKIEGSMLFGDNLSKVHSKRLFANLR